MAVLNGGGEWRRNDDGPDLGLPCAQRMVAGSLNVPGVVRSVPSRLIEDEFPALKSMRTGRERARQTGEGVSASRERMSSAAFLPDRSMPPNTGPMR